MSALQLKAPWQWAANARSPLWRWLSATVWALLVVAPMLAAWRWLPPPVAAVIVALVVSMTLGVLWSVQFAALLRLDHPNLARLVPGHAARLRGNALAVWAAAALLGGAFVAAVLGGASLPALAMPFAAALPVGVVAMAAALLALALAVRWPLLWLVLVLLLMPGTYDLLWVLVRAVQPLWRVEPWLAAAALLAAMGWGLGALFGRGDAAHAQAWQQRDNLRRIAEAGPGNRPGLAAYGRWGEWLARPWQQLADAWLGRATRSARPEAGSAMTRAEIVLHGAQHWARLLGVLVPLLLGVVLMLAVLAWRAGPDGAAKLFAHAHFGIGIGLLSMTLGPVVGLPVAVWASRREQALLLLLPGLPRGAALNRALAWRQARQVLLLWGLTLPVYATLAWAGAAPHLLLMPAAALLALPWMCRDLSRQRAPGAASAVLPVVGFLALGIGSAALARGWPGLLLPLLAGLVLLSGAWWALRWRQLARWPQALPAARWG